MHTCGLNFISSEETDLPDKTFKDLYLQHALDTDGMME